MQSIEYSNISLILLNMIYDFIKKNILSFIQIRFMITTKRIENSFMNIFYYEIKRLIFKVIKNKKMLLHLLLRLNTSLSSRLLR